MRVRFNAPVTLVMVLGGLAVLGLGYFFPELKQTGFSSPASFENYTPQDLVRCLSYVLGHADWSHFAGNALFLLLVGPAVEEKYGSWTVLGLTVATAALTAVISAFVFKSSIMGASGVVFMLIILNSITNVRQGELPLTFILIAGLFLGREGLAIFQDNNTSQLAHVLGGLCGGIFGLAFGRKKAPQIVTGS